MPSPANKATASTATSRSLLVRLKDDDHDAWARFVSLYTPLIYYWCRKLGLAEQDMPDVFQEIFQAVSRNIGDFRRDRPGDSLRGWLRTITRSKVYDHFRRLQRDAAPASGGSEAQARIAELPEPFDDEEEESSAGETSAEAELLHRALELVRPHFAEQTWQAFWQTVVDGRTPEEVGTALSMRPGTVRVAKSRVLQRLRQELGEVME